MALPESLVQVWIVGELTNNDGPQRGRTTFQASTSEVVNQTLDLKHSLAAPFVGVHGVDGSIAVPVVASDSPGWSPAGFTYTVTEPARRAYSILVPASTPVLNSPGHPQHGKRVLDLSDAQVLPEPNPGTVQVIQPPPASAEDIAAAVETYLDEHPPDGGLAAQVDAIETEQEAHHIRLDTLEDQADEVPDLIDAAVATHRQASAPHPAYDDLPSLRLLLENGLV